MKIKAIAFGVILAIVIVFIFAIMRNQMIGYATIGFAKNGKTGQAYEPTPAQKTQNPEEKAIETKDENKVENEVILYFFYGEGCPHCAKQKPFLEKMEQKYPTLVVKAYEVWHNQENKALFYNFAKAFGVNASGVPTTFIGEFNPIVGFGSEETTGRLIEERISYCVERGCIDAMAKVK
ncbi:MAG: thioredoxin family protein [Candidatus Diapherotrites archaeon]|nr:thioredoxin family protein [Candidatus Diapherotrites archaeon]